MSADWRKIESELEAAFEAMGYERSHHGDTIVSSPFQCSLAFAGTCGAVEIRENEINLTELARRLADVIGADDREIARRAISELEKMWAKA